MRGLIEGATTRRPIATGLPAMYDDDDFAQRLTGALDEVVAPLHLTLDNLAAHLDPWLAPLDVVRWLGTWVGADEWSPALPEAALRSGVAHAVDRHGTRGTARGLVSEVVRLTGCPGHTVRVEDSGGVLWSAVPTQSAPADHRVPDRWTVAVRIRATEDVLRAVDAASLAEALAPSLPAHVTVNVVVELEAGS